MKRLFFLLTLLLPLLWGCPRPTDHAPAAASAGDRMLPAITSDDQVVEHCCYTLSYSEADEQARWVAYMLCRSRADGEVSRTDYFEEDPDVRTGSATYNDYRRSGYSRGHLMPAADVRWDETAMRESFLMSNVSPQLSQFNDGVWNRLEGKMRYWAKAYDTLYIVTGPVLKGLHGKSIGTVNRVSVPEYFYKAVYCPATQQAIAFLVKHEGSKAPLQSFVVSVDELEQVTGLDFFPELDDALENRIEAVSCVDCWKW